MRIAACVALLLSWPCLAQARQAAPASAPAAGPHAEEGRPFIRNYRPREVSGEGQNWAIVQDARGVIYVGSNAGVIEYDGATWRLIETPTIDTVRSLDIDANGRIYAGSVSEFGYLAPDAVGKLQWVSLLNRVPAEAREFGDVWRTFATPAGVIFQTNRVIFRLANDKISVIRPTARMGRASFLDGQLYATVADSGLNVLEGDHFKKLPGTEALAREPFPVVLRYDQRHLLIGTRSNGLFLYDGASLAPFATAADARLKPNTLYRGLALPDGTFALGTTNAGFVIIDRQGHQLAAIDQASGLGSNAAYYMMRDREGALWLAGGRGLSRVETESPASFFDQVDGYQDALDLRRHDGRLYLATTVGLSYLRSATLDDPRRFGSVTGPNTQCWSFETVPDSAGQRPAALVAGCSSGLYQVSGTTSQAISAVDGSINVSVLLRSKAVPSRLWVGRFDGLGSYRWENGRWIDEGALSNVVDQIRTLYENPDGSVWAGTASTGLLRLTFATTPRPGEPRPAVSVRRFGVADGIPEGGVGVMRIGDAPAFTRWGSTHDRVILRYDTSKGAFVVDHSFDGVARDPLQSGFGVVTGPDGTLIADFGKGPAILTRAADGSWSVDRATLARFGTQNGSPPLVEPDRVVWLTPNDSLVRIELGRAAKTAAVPFSTLVRQVTANQNRGLYAGSTAMPAPRLPSTDDSFRFEFAAPTFADEAATEYQSPARRVRPRLVAVDARGAPRLHQPRDSATIASASARATSSARSATRPLTRSPSCRRGIGRGGRISATLPSLACAALRRRAAAAPPRGRQGARARAVRRSTPASRGRRGAGGTESEGKKNVELLSEMGREITASLDFDTIFGRLYERVNQLADADVFGVGLYHPERQRDRIPLAIEKRQALRALHPRHDRSATSSRSGASSTASRCSSTTCAPSTGKYISTLRRASAAARGRHRCRRSRSRSSTCRSSPRIACSASSRSRASRRTPTPSITST